MKKAIIIFVIFFIITTSFSISAYGAEGIDNIQNILLDLGYNLGSCGADGIYGPVTRKAICLFQKDNDIAITGRIDSKTLNMLNKKSKAIEQSRKDDISRYEVMLLAKLIWEEARGESYEGMVSVGEVVLNRVDTPNAWADTISGVIYQKGQFVSISGSYNDTTLEAALEAVGGSNYTDGAQYFFNPEKCSPSWAKDCIKCSGPEGKHDFYKRPE